MSKKKKVKHWKIKINHTKNANKNESPKTS